MFFVETTPGTYCLNKQFRLKNYFVARDSSPEIDKFCWQLRDGINDIVENYAKFDCNSNLSIKRKTGTSQTDYGKKQSTRGQRHGQKSWASKCG